MLIHEVHEHPGIGPKEVDESNVQYWCRHTKELKNTQVSKALKFMRYECLRYLGEAFNEKPILQDLKEKYPGARHIFVCLPLNTSDKHEFLGITLPKKEYEKNYNNSEYFIFKRPDGTFECNCQGWQSKANRGELTPEGANCSHVLALYYCFKIKRFGRGHGAGEDHLRPDLDIIRGDQDV